METQSLAGLGPAELEKVISPLPRFRAVQIYKWIIKGVSDFEQMTDIPNSLRTELKDHFRLFSGSVVSCHEDADTMKTAIVMEDGQKIEAVLLNDGKNRLTACLSTQCGCPAGCVFCKTGTLGFKRNLNSNEIVEQFFLLTSLAAANEKAQKKEEHLKEKHIIDNIVIMGMGEPLLNLEQLRKAISILNDPSGLNFSRRRITVSTCGICSSMFDIAENGPFVRLALSLTTADEILRQKLMPVTAANPLQKVKEALSLFQHNGGGRITLEIPLLGGINTRDQDVVLIARFAEGIDSVINIIPWNPVEGLEFEGNVLHEPSKKEIVEFIKKLENLGLKVTTRLRKGRGVLGACGQLG
ncbi:MAG: 23S rRNA (adenine(2503)-C(2))-methyltransferase RlmN [Treponema sp.]|jgi:23S rRNA (adenine2503-C2)-methyltransferase|nr:23S rRNA (adenine(2503)-C(2))-methyltransferase RlmN [Treponema sp.]